MKRAYKRYTPEFRDAVVRRYLETEMTYIEIEAETGVSGKTLAKWVKEYREREAGK